MLKIYNSLTRKKDIFEPLIPNQVSLYACGITVYDYCHIGHARTTIAFDLITRFLRYSGFSVKYIRNITDIDDKIIDRAQKNNEAWTTLTERFIAAMREDFSALNILPPSAEPRATEAMDIIIQLVSRLVENKVAYVADNGDVYFSVEKYPNYGTLSCQDLEHLQAGARVHVTQEKKNPLDFVLWKSAKAGEPSWPSPWGAGRPGWHIECSAMSMQALGEQFDLHGGGHDLLFPHHENERAQAEAATGKKFVNYWLHVGFVQVDNEKMSKSLNNFFTIRDVLKTFDAETVRYFLVASHYRSQVNYSEDNLRQARASLTTLYIALDDVPEMDKNTVMSTELEAYRAEFIAAMEDDFNTPVAVSTLFTMASQLNKFKQSESEVASQYAALLKELGNVLGILQQFPRDFLQQSQTQVTSIGADKIDLLIAERVLARTQKNWALSDQIRQKLDDLGVILEDGASGTQWRWK